MVDVEQQRAQLAARKAELESRLVRIDGKLDEPMNARLEAVPNAALCQSCQAEISS